MERSSGIRLEDRKRHKLRGCPNCGRNYSLGEIDLIPGAALGYFNEKGQWTFQGQTKVFWDDQKAEHDPAQFVCFDCDTVFDLLGRIY